MVLVHALTMLPYTRGGGGIFLNIRNSIILWVVLYALCHRKPIFFLTIKFYFLPPVQIVKIHYNPKNENHHMWMFDNSNEAYGSTGYNAKNPNS